MPGIELAINTLFELLIGQGTSYTDLAKLKMQGKSYPVLISKGIKGDNLDEVLRSPDKITRLNHLDPLSFSELLLASLLINFEDGKPDNFILQALPNDTYCIIGIDNDHAFVPPLGRKNGKTVVWVKCILYCLDSMQQPIHPVARERFLSFIPEQWMRLWLNRLRDKAENYNRLFSSKEREYLFDKQSVVIAIPFRQNSIVQLYQRFMRVQMALKESPQLTGMELLRLVIPPLGIRYEKAFHNYPHPLERFFSLTNTQYSLAVKGNYQTLVGSRQLLQSMQISEQVMMDQFPGQGPTAALQELQLIEQERRYHGHHLQKIRDALQSGDPASFLNLKLDLSKERVINGMPGFFNGIDFKAMQLRGKPDIKKQTLIFSALLTGNYRTISFKGCAVLDRNSWQNLINTSPMLLTLDLCECPEINDEFLLLLEQANFLNRLRLVDLPKLTSVTLPHSSLRRLQIIRCHRLQQLTFSHTLKHLSLESCWELTALNVKLYELRLLRSSLMVTNVMLFMLESLRIHACPKLVP